MAFFDFTTWQSNTIEEARRISLWTRRRGQLEGEAKKSDGISYRSKSKLHTLCYPRHRHTLGQANTGARSAGLTAIVLGLWWSLELGVVTGDEGEIAEKVDANRYKPRAAVARPRRCRMAGRPVYCPSSFFLSTPPLWGIRTRCMCMNMESTVLTSCLQVTRS